MYLSYHGWDPGKERKTCLILSSKHDAPVTKTYYRDFNGIFSKSLQFKLNMLAFLFYSVQSKIQGLGDWLNSKRRACRVSVKWTHDYVLESHDK